MSNKDLIEFGKKIKALRKSRKLSQEELAFNAGIDRAYLSRIERGINNPTYLVIKSLATALKITILEIFLIE